MYKVMLVDDDYLVLEYLNKKIPWKDLGYAVISLCQDGQKALQYIREGANPDVIITDIGMPIMDGIALIKNIKDMKKDIESIFLTCHDDFSMAQQALRLNSFDYILKESMDMNSIIQLLKRLKEKLDQEKNQQLEIKSMINENLNVLKDRLLELLMNGNSHDITNWFDKHKNELKLNWDFKKSIPVLCFVDDYKKQQSNFGSSDLLSFTIQNVITELLDETQKGFSVSYKDSMFFILYSPDSKSESTSLETVQRSLKEVNSTLDHLFDISFTALIGNNSEFHYDLTDKLKLLTSSKDQRFYTNNGSIIKVNVSPFISDNIFKDYTDAMEEFRRLVIQENKQDLEKMAKKWLENFKGKFYQPQLVKEWVTHLLLDIEQVVNSMSKIEYSIISVDNQKIMEAETIVELETLFIHGLNSNVKKVKMGHSLSTRDEILRAQRYVIMNLDKKITLRDVAAYVHMNPSYFSRLYKKDTNENFIDFINRSKMEKAKELIESTNKSIEDIAYMLGFENKSYFLKVFKNFFGEIPKYYKGHSFRKRIQPKGHATVKFVSNFDS